MTERYKFMSFFCTHYSRYLCNSENVSLGSLPHFYRLICFGGHCDPAVSLCLPFSLFFTAYIHHMSLAVAIEVCQFHIKSPDDFSFYSRSYITAIPSFFQSLFFNEIFYTGVCLLESVKRFVLKKMRLCDIVCRNGYSVKIIRFLSLLLLFLTLLLWSPLARGEDKALPWIEMIKKEEALLLDAKKELEKYISAQPDRIQKVREKTEELNQQLRKLIIIYNIEEGNPIELRDKLRQIEHIRTMKAGT